MKQLASALAVGIMLAGLWASPAVGAAPLYTASYACPDKSDPGQRMFGVDRDLTMRQVQAIKNFLKHEFCTNRQLEYFIVTRQ